MQFKQESFLNTSKVKATNTSHIQTKAKVRQPRKNVQALTRKNMSENIAHVEKKIAASAKLRATSTLLAKRRSKKKRMKTPTWLRGMPKRSSGICSGTPSLTPPLYL